MAWFQVCLSEEELRIVKAERREHPHKPTQLKMEVLWLLHNGLTREKAAQTAGVSRVTAQRYARAYRDGGLEGLRRWNVKGQISDLEAYREMLAESFEKQPVASVAEAADRIEQLTGIRRGLTQTRRFMKKLGLKCWLMAAIPVPPKKTSRSMWQNSGSFSTKS